MLQSYDKKLSSSASNSFVSSSRVSNSDTSTKEKKATFVLPSATGRKGKIVSEHPSPADDGKDRNLPLIVGTEMTERTIAPQPVGS
ncbi:hypothetical protein V6N11_015812 [Hibiscus sabdariffa]|uniref:Uncharacterized protein n=1 Tax=Hibiscus sabdariffa TaxID=183260 RepID=A0ABR2TTK0_9ROSI